MTKKSPIQKISKNVYALNNMKKNQIITPPTEISYPICHIKVSWEEDESKQSREYMKEERYHLGLPDGRVRNSTSYDRMLKTDKSIQYITNDELATWWPSLIEEDKKKRGDLNLSNPQFTIEFRRKEVWCLTWFSHWTWDIGLSDDEILQSFSRYIDRTLELNRKEGEFRKFADGTSYFWEPYCLMGAEDRWRWRGSKTGNPNNEEFTNPPCRCPHCKEQGVIHIMH